MEISLSPWRTPANGIPHLAGLSTGFYIAYLFAEIPSNYLMQRLNIGPTVGVCMFFWGK